MNAGPVRLATMTFVVVSAVTLGAMLALGRPAMQTGDTRTAMFPLVLESWREVREGRLPEWSDLCWSGTPLVGNGAVGALYAPYGIGFALTPEPHLRAFDVAGALHAGWFAAGTVMLLGTLGVSPGLCLVGGALALSARFANWTAFAFIPAYIALTWWPWVLLAAERLARGSTVTGPLLLGSFALAAQVIVGFPEHALSAAIAAAAWILLRGGDQPLRRRVWLVFLLALGSGALSAPAMLPVVAQVQESRAATASPVPGFAALPVAALGRLIDVRAADIPAGATTLGFLGLVATVLAVLGTTRAPLYGAFALFALLMALGDQTPWYPAVRVLPGFSLTRNPIKFVAFVEVLVAWLAALGLERIRGSGGRGRTVLVWSLAALALSERGMVQWTALSRYAAMSDGPGRIDTLRRELEAGGLVAQTGNAALPLKIVDAAPIAVDTHGLLLGCVPAIDRVAAFYGGLLNLVTRRHPRFPMPITPPALELFGIQAAVGYGKKQCERFATLPGFRAGSPANDLCVLWTLHPRPAYEVVYEVAILGSDEEARDAIERNPAAPIPVVSSPEAIAGVRATASGGSVAVRSYRNGAVDLRTRTPEPAVLVARHKWHPGWTAEVDGRQVPLLRAVGMYMAVVLPAGEHEVRLRYHEPGLRAGLAIAGAWLILTIGAGFVERRRRGRASPAG